MNKILIKQVIRRYTIEEDDITTFIIVVTSYWYFMDEVIITEDIDVVAI